LTSIPRIERKGLIYFTQVYTAMELAAKLWPCFKYIIPIRRIAAEPGWLRMSETKPEAHHSVLITDLGTGC
jgi:hypothetical protein